jgi:hypothetical protein
MSKGITHQHCGSRVECQLPVWLPTVVDGGTELPVTDAETVRQSHFESTVHKVH